MRRKSSLGINRQGADEGTARGEPGTTLKYPYHPTPARPLSPAKARPTISANSSEISTTRRHYLAVCRGTTESWSPAWPITSLNGAIATPTCSTADQARAVFLELLAAYSRKSGSEFLYCFTEAVSGAVGPDFAAEVPRFSKFRYFTTD